MINHFLPLVFLSFLIPRNVQEHLLVAERLSARQVVLQRRPPSQLGFVCTVLARLYAPPFCIIVRRKRRGGGRLIEVCTNAPNLRPPPTQRGFRGNSLYCAAHAESRGCHKITIIIVHNSQTRDGRIVGHVPQNWQDFLVHSSVTCRITDVRRQSKGKGLVVCSLCLHLPRQDKSPGKAVRHISTSYVGSQID